MSSAPRCTAGLLTWNGERDVVTCAKSLIAQTEANLEIVWVDNASTDSTRSRVAEEVAGFPSALIMEANTGFCTGHNTAFKMGRGRYYLAVNQDAVLAPDYIRLLCDWMDEEPNLAMVSGVILWGGETQNMQAHVYSAGMAMGFGRFPFELHRDEPLSESMRKRRLVPAVTGAAMLIRREAVQMLDPRGHRIFPPEFFAYFEEVDLALRIAEAGWKCGVEGRAIAWHAERGEGGKSNTVIRTHYLKNHWLISARHDGLMDIMRESLGILRGEFRHYLPRYLASPQAFFSALLQFMKLIAPARQHRRQALHRFAHFDRGRAEFYRESRELLKGSR